MFCVLPRVYTFPRSSLVTSERFSVQSLRAWKSIRSSNIRDFMTNKLAYKVAMPLMRIVVRARLISPGSRSRVVDGDQDQDRTRNLAQSWRAHRQSRSARDYRQLRNNPCRRLCQNRCWRRVNQSVSISKRVLGLPIGRRPDEPGGGRTRSRPRAHVRAPSPSAEVPPAISRFRQRSSAVD
jgi:hypothetical protein